MTGKQELQSPEKQLAKKEGGCRRPLPALSALSALSFLCHFLWDFSFARLEGSQSLHSIGEPSSTMDRHPPYITHIIPGSVRATQKQHGLPPDSGKVEMFL